MSGQENLHRAGGHLCVQRFPSAHSYPELRHHQREQNRLTAAHARVLGVQEGEVSSLRCQYIFGYTYNFKACLPPTNLRASFPARTHLYCPWCCTRTVRTLPNTFPAYVQPYLSSVPPPTLSGTIRCSRRLGHSRFRDYVLLAR